MLWERQQKTVKGTHCCLIYNPIAISARCSTQQRFFFLALLHAAAWCGCLCLFPSPLSMQVNLPWGRRTTPSNEDNTTKQKREAPRAAHGGTVLLPWLLLPQLLL